MFQQDRWHTQNKLNLLKVSLVLVLTPFFETEDMDNFELKMHILFSNIERKRFEKIQRKMKDKIRLFVN